MKLIRKLILGVATTGLVAVTLAATTYAWYKLGNAAFTESFEFNASTTEGFVVSIDGVTFKHKLTTDDMLKAMLVKYSPTNFVLEDGELKFTRENKFLTSEQIREAYAKNILLAPLTSTDGISITNLNKTEVSSLDGKYGEVELYLKCISDDMIESEDGAGNKTQKPSQKFELYLDGNDYDDGHVKAGGTDVWSGVSTPVKLMKNKVMTYLDKDLNIVNKLGTETSTTPESKVDVYTSNAFRFSIQDLGYVTEVEEDVYDEEDPTQIIGTRKVSSTTKANDKDSHIFELSREKNYNLGSYATNYNLGKTQNFTELDRLYNADYNAMYVYYNSVKESDPLTDLLPTTHPDTITDLSSNQTLTTVESGKVTKILLKFWIEGWDADCFDGLPGTIDEETGKPINNNPINVQLLFNSKKVD